MGKRDLLILALACAVLLGAGHLLQRAGADQTDRTSAPPDRVIIKLCNWDGVVPEKALDGFTMPGGKWADYQRAGWKVESYVVAPNAEGRQNGLYAVMVK